MKEGNSLNAQGPGGYVKQREFLEKARQQAKDLDGTELAQVIGMILKHRATSYPRMDGCYPPELHWQAQFHNGVWTVLDALSGPAFGALEAIEDALAERDQIA